MKYPYTASIVCEMTETYIGIVPESIRHYRTDDILKLAFLLPDDPAIYEKLERIAMSDKAVELYRNSVWVKVRVTHREFFILHYDEPRNPQSGTVFVAPCSSGAHQCLLIVREFQGKQTTQAQAT